MPEKPTERERRKVWDAAYRDKNREKRREYDRQRMRTQRAAEARERES
jgi:hypothetical protein